MKSFTVFALSVFVMSNIVFAGGDIISTVLVVKGDVKAKTIDGKIVDVTSSMGFPEGTFIKTEENSFVKVVFIDRSYMTLGPKSLIKISAFSKTEAGIISLIRGQIRSQVTKDYMELEDHKKSKLFIRTKSAVMGIRGTDFQVNFSSEQESTTLITYEGKVAMNKIDQSKHAGELNQKELDKLLERKDRIMVTRGLVSNIDFKTKMIEPPKKLDNKEMEKLKNQDVPKNLNPEKVNQKLKEENSFNEISGQLEKPQSEKPQKDSQKENQKENPPMKKEEELMAPPKSDSMDQKPPRIEKENNGGGQPMGQPPRKDDNLPPPPPRANEKAPPPPPPVPPAKK